MLADDEIYAQGQARLAGRARLCPRGLEALNFELLADSQVSAQP